MMDNENLMFMLVESRSTAGYVMKDAVDALGKYVEGKLKALYENSKKDVYSFSIPRDIVSDMKFMKNVNIHVVCHLVDNPVDMFELTGSGKMYPDKNHRFGITYEYGKSFLRNVSIDICCYFNRKGRIYKGTLYGSLYHEINHAFSIWLELTNNENLSRLAFEHGKLISRCKEFPPVVNAMIYRLFDADERNAVIASVYGELKGMDSERKNFQRDYRKTQAYLIYNSILSEYESAILDMDDAIVRRICIDNFGKSGDKAYLMSMTKEKLDDLLNGIGTVASLWYDEKEGFEINTDELNVPFF